jgi:hypothetical protein
MYGFVSDLFANNDDQEMMTSVLMFLQDIAYFDDLVSIRKFTEAVGLFNNSFFYTIFRKISDE